MWLEVIRKTNGNTRVKPDGNRIEYDSAIQSRVNRECELRSYQRTVIRNVFHDALCGHGGSFAVMFPRQSGKNEVQAHLETSLLLSYSGSSGSIIKAAPTKSQQGRVSLERLRGVLQKSGAKALYRSGDTLELGKSRLRFLSAHPQSTAVGATANILLEVDEAQDVSIRKFDQTFLPMAASTNATRVFWGTAWDDTTLLARELRTSNFAFITNADKVGAEVPAYKRFVEQQIRKMGRDHPMVRTQYFCEEITDQTALFTPERIEKMKGTHAPQDFPMENHSYVFLIDVAGSDEMSVEQKRNIGFGDRRDATVVTICDITESNSNGTIWKTVARRYFRNVPTARVQSAIASEIRHWDPLRVVIDHTGLGSGLSNYLNREFTGLCTAVDITSAVKSKMGWDFLAMVSSGRWQEYTSGTPSAFRADPSRDTEEILNDPALLQEMFYNEIHFCRSDPSASGLLRWGVPAGTPDPADGRQVHDDLLLSAALSAILDQDLPIVSYSEYVEYGQFNMEEE